jgi:hypothetical protein
LNTEFEWVNQQSGGGLARKFKCGNPHLKRQKVKGKGQK